MVICVFDTETVGKVSQDLLNVGYRIIDINPVTSECELLKERDYVVTDLINNSVYMLNDDFVGAEKYGKYLIALKNKTCIKRSINQIFTTMKNDFKRYNVLFTYAYNNKFDIDKFERTALKYGIENPIEALPSFDIWAYAVKYICQTAPYIEWAKENQVFTETGLYIQTSVEAVVKYLTQDLNFVEDHTALSDTKWETMILVECLKRGCDITKNIKLERNIASEQVFKKTMKLPDGQTIDIEYRKSYERNGVITYK